MSKTVFFKNSFMLLAAAACALTVACSEKDKAPLEGERLSVLELQKTLEPDQSGEGAALIAPAVWRNEYWPQNGGYPNHAMQNLDWNGANFKPIWSVSIGAGGSDSLPLTAQPVVVEGRVYTMDADMNVRAFATQNGKKIWQTNVMAKGEDDPVIGGGLAMGSGVLYVTSGYNEVLALSAGDGKILWRHKIPVPSRAAPTVSDERLFITTMDNRVLALSAQSGQDLWEYAGISATEGLVGAASPAANKDIVVPVFSSGEISALRVENGAVAWSDNLSGIRRVGGLSGMSHIRALPVIDQNLVFAISFAGKLVAIDTVTGTRVWQKEIGGTQTPWVAGNHVFVVTSQDELVALGRDQGTISWVTQLQRYEDPDDNTSRPIIWSGPVFAGGRLVVASDNGFVLEIEPQSGKILRRHDTGKDVRIAPLVAGGTLYLLAEDGTLSAYQ